VGKTRVKVEPVVVVIRASRWWRATKRRREGAKSLTNGRLDCCLASDGRAFGVTTKDMRGAVNPCELDSAVSHKAREWEERWTATPASKMDNAISINDDPSTTDDQKIEKLRPIFAALTPPRVIDWRPNE
jgi:hypothetical protein